MDKIYRLTNYGEIIIDELEILKETKKTYQVSVGAHVERVLKKDLYGFSTYSSEMWGFDKMLCLLALLDKIDKDVEQANNRISRLKDKRTRAMEALESL